ncbi:MAG: ABC transporter permease [Clostridiales bacterium]|jgi:putative ABC transport system permease protein|nr:ABC transporter permease [Clostridiales bacterium]
MEKKFEIHVRVLRLVLKSLATNKKRCLFAVMGIIIGITAVTTLVSLGQSTQQALAQELEKLGTNLLIIEAARNPNTSRGRGGQPTTVETLVESDIVVLTEEISDIAFAAPVLQMQGELKAGATVVKTSVIATRSEFMTIRNLSVAAGRMFLDEEDAAARRVILLGHTVSGQLFGGIDPLGENIRVNNVLFEVIGVLAEKGLDANGEDQDDVVVIPLTTAQRRLAGVKYLTHIYVRATGTDSLDVVKEGIISVLRTTHHLVENEPSDFNVLDQAELVAARTDILGSVEDLVRILALVTLLAGGLGITAVQLVSIRERTWEIGLHRAVGARKKDIVNQYLIEAMILGGLGGLSGVALGLIAPVVIAYILALQPVIAWSALLVSFIISMIIGIIAGIYPAFYASQLDPVVALRTA